MKQALEESAKVTNHIKFLTQYECTPNYYIITYVGNVRAFYF